MAKAQFNDPVEIIRANSTNSDNGRQTIVYLCFFLNTTNHEQSNPQQPPQDPLRQTQPSIRPRLYHAPSHRACLYPHARFFLLFLP